VLGYRMAAVLLSATILGHALARSRRFGASAWLVAALTPSAWFLMGVVDTSGIEIALVVLALVEAVGRFRSPARADSLNRVVVPLAVCLLLRPAAFIDVAVVALFVLPTLPRPLTIRLSLTLLSPLALAGLATVAWNRWIGLVFSDHRTADANSTATAIRTSIEGIPKMAHQTVGALGWNEFFAPFAAQLIWAATLSLAVWWVFSRGSGRWWHVAWATAALVLPTVVEVLVHRSIGAIWQGRYSIPFAIGGVLYAARWATPPRAVMRGVVIAAAFAEVVTLWWTLRRYMVGMEGSLTMQHASWHPPINPWLLLAVNGAAIAWLCAVALASGDDEFGSAGAADLAGVIGAGTRRTDARPEGW
jgi:hypothetical protein